MDNDSSTKKNSIKGRIDLEKLAAEIANDKLAPDIDDAIRDDSLDLPDCPMQADDENADYNCVIDNLNEYSDDCRLGEETNASFVSHRFDSPDVDNRADDDHIDENMSGITSELQKYGVMNTLNERASTRVKGNCAGLFLPFAVIAFLSLCAEIFTCLLLFPLAGMCYTMLDNSVYKADKSDKITFKSFFLIKNTGAGIKTTAIYRLMLLAGTVCLIIPAVFVYCNYSMFSLVLSDKNESDTKKAFDTFLECRELMSGHKLQYLRLTLYMVFPIILTVLSLGLLSIWTIPYIASLKVEFYIAIKNAEIPKFKLNKRKK